MRIVVSLTAIILALLTSTVVGAEDQTGTISGRVYDARTGHLLPLANVFVEGTSRGAVTDLDGYYVIASLPLGSYTLEARHVGYKVSRIKNVQVVAGPAKTVDFRLEESKPEPADPHYFAYPLHRYFSDHSWGTTRSSMVVWKVPRERFQRRRLTGLETSLDILPGVTWERDGIHVRGARNTDFAWKIDGTSATDPLYGDRALSVPLLAMSNVAVTTVTSETNSPGSEAAGIIPQLPGGGFSGGATVASKLPDQSQEMTSYDAELWIRGPLLRRQGLHFLCSGQTSVTPSPFLPALSDEKRHAGFLKLDWYLPPAPTSLRLNLAGSVRECDRYDHRWFHNPSGLPRSQEQSSLSALTWHHNIASGSAYYQLSLSNLRVARQVRVKEKDWEDYLPPSTDPYGWIPSYFFTAGDYPLWHKSIESSYSAEGLLEVVVSPVTQVKTGFELKRYDLELDRNELLDTLLNETSYAYSPSCFAFYVQDHIESPGMIVNFGGRLQGFRGDGASSLRLQLLPRLGVLLPITDKDKAFLSYGHFGRMPSYRFLSADRIGLHGDSPVFGNPDLSYERVVTYQAGLQRLISRRLIASLSVFKRQATDLLEVIGRPGFEGEHFTLSNRGELYSQGLECLAEAVFWKYLRGQLNYTYSITRGDELRTNEWFELDYYQQLNGRVPFWDRRHSISGDVFLEFEGKGIMGGGEIGMSGRHSSGFPYYVQEERHTSSHYFVLDTFTRASFNILGLKQSAFVSVFNLFGRRNVLDVDECAGEPGGTFADPTHWGQGRRVVVGTSVGW